MTGSSTAAASWLTVSLVGLYLAAIPQMVRTGRDDGRDLRSFFSVLAFIMVAVAVLTVIACVATLLVLRAERRQWPADWRWPASNRWVLWSWLLGLVAAIATGASSHQWHFGLAMAIALIGIVMSACWRRHDREVSAHQLLVSAVVSQAPGSEVGPPFGWDASERTDR